MFDSAEQLLTDDEIVKLFDIINKQYGYDFSDYSEASIKRRINKVMNMNGMTDFGTIAYKIVNDGVFFNNFLEDLTVNVTEMFRDSGFFKALRKEVIPQLSTYPFIRIWIAGCSTGEEVYSMAILLREAGVLDRSLIYATDINQHVLDVASRGEYPISLVKDYTENYIASGGVADFSQYYTAIYGKVVFDTELRKRMVFSHHNLAADQSFNEFNLISCRNVMIYFNKILQNRVLQLFANSMSSFGYLALGKGETINFSTIVNEFVPVDKVQRIWKRKM